MSYYYPQACVKLRLLPEDFKLTSDASLQTPYEIIVIPRELTYNANDHKTCDSFSMEIDYKSFPFDPRTMRAIGVVIHIEDLGRLQNSDGSYKKIQPSDANAIFQGFADEETVSFDDDRRTVKFEGRDFSALLIDQKYQENVPISMHQPLDVVIAKFLAGFKATQQIKVVNLTGQSTLPTLAQYYPGFGSGLTGYKNPGPHETYWEIIQDMVNRAGLISYMHLDKLVITTPRNLYSQADDLKFVYGSNLASLSFKRKLGRLKGFNIQVRSRVGKTVLTAKIPEEATPAWCTSFGISRERVTIPVLKPDGTVDKTATAQTAPYITFPIPNVGNKDQLIRIGESVFEDYSRQQLEGTFETTEMLGHYGPDKNFQSVDLTQLQVGQPVAIDIATDDLVAISRIANAQERENYLIRKNFPRNIAHAFATSMGKFSPRFFTKALRISMSQDNGFKLSVDFVNIIETSYKGLT